MTGTLSFGSVEIELILVLLFAGVLAMPPEIAFGLAR